MPNIQTRLAMAAMLAWAGSLAVGAQGGTADADISANAVVAADGTGQYRTVQEAINAAPQNTYFPLRGVWQPRTWRQFTRTRHVGKNALDEGSRNKDMPIPSPPGPAPKESGR